MSEQNDIAGSDDIILLNGESQETFTEHSYRVKQAIVRTDKNSLVKDQAKENQKPIEQENIEEAEDMHTDAQNCLLSSQIDDASVEQPPPVVESQTDKCNDNAFCFQPPAAPPALNEEDKSVPEKDQPSTDEQAKSTNESTSKSKSDSCSTALDASTIGNNLHLYISPSTSLLETTNDDAQPPEEKNQADDNKPKDEPMDTNDAQASLGSDVITEPTKVPSPQSNKVQISPVSKSLYSLSQPATNKFESILAKLNNSPTRRVSSINNNESATSTATREEEELYIRESVSKILRRYAVKVDQNGRTLSRELLSERTVEENVTTRVESWPPIEKKARRSTVTAKKPTRPSQTTGKKTTKTTTTNTPKPKARRSKSTSNAAISKKSKYIDSDDDDVSKSNTNDDTTDDDEEKKKDTEDDEEEEEEEKEDDDAPTDDISGDEFEPTEKSSVGQPLTKGMRVFAKWVDGHFYPGAISNISGEKYMIEFDDGAKRYVKAHDIVAHGYLEVKQSVLAQTQDGFFDTGVIKRLIKKKKTGKLGYIVEKDGKEKWYPLRFISLTHEQADKLSTVNNNKQATAAATTTKANATQGKRKRTLTAPQSPNKKSKTSNVSSPNKNPRTTFTPTRQTKLFNAMYFLMTGFNDSMDFRQKLHESIESHGGKVVEKMPPASRRGSVYLISDIARKTAKFFDAKRLNVPCLNFEWINECIAKSEIQEWEKYKLVLPEKETKTEDDDDDENEDDGENKD